MSWDIHILGKWGIKEDHFNWGHLGKHCIWTTLHYADPQGITDHSGILMKYQPFWCNIDQKFKNINHLSEMVDYWPLVDIIDPVASLTDINVFIYDGFNDSCNKGGNACIYTGLNDFVYTGLNAFMYTAFNNYAYSGRNAVRYTGVH